MTVNTIINALLNRTPSDKTFTTEQIEEMLATLHETDGNVVRAALIDAFISRVQEETIRHSFRVKFGTGEEERKRDKQGFEPGE